MPLRLLLSVMLLLNLVAWLWWSGVGENDDRGSGFDQKQRLQNTASLVLLSEVSETIEQNQQMAPQLTAQALLIPPYPRRPVDTAPDPLEMLVVEYRELPEQLAELDPAKAGEELSADLNAPQDGEALQASEVEQDIDEVKPEQPALVDEVVVLAARSVEDQGADEEQPVIPESTAEQGAANTVTELAASAYDADQLLDTSCMRLGPFDDQAELIRLEASLMAQQLNARRVQVEVVTGQRFWVLLPPPSSEEERQTITEQLSGRGLETYVVGEGEYNNHLSLGYFENQQNAENHSAKLLELGQQALIRPVETRESVYWLEMAPKTSEQAEKLAEIQQKDPAFTLSGCAELADRE